MTAGRADAGYSAGGAVTIADSRRRMLRATRGVADVGYSAADTPVQAPSCVTGRETADGPSGGTGRRFRTVSPKDEAAGVAYLMPVVAMPLMRNRWPKRNTRKTGQQGHDGHREQRAPARGRLRVHEGAQGHGNSEHVRVRQVDQGAEEVVPGPDEREDGGGGQGRHHQGQDDAQEDAGVAGAVDPCGLVQFLGNTADELDHQEDEERVGGQQLRAQSAARRCSPSRSARTGCTAAR